MKIFDTRRAVGGGGSATHVAHCNNIHTYFGHWCDVLPLIGGRLFRMPRGEDAKRQSLLRLGDFDLYKKFVDILSLFKRNILISPLEGEKKFLSELRELSNKGRLGILAQREAGFEPSPFSGEVIDSVISSDFKSKILVNNENILPRKELSALVPPYLSNFSDTVFSRFTSHFSHKRTAFSLAEVLITLGIIGIVASLTLPSVINNYKRKQLEVAFKRSSSTLMNALNQTAIEAGYSNYRDLIVCDFVVQDKDSASCVLGNQELFKELNAIFESKLNIVKKISWYDLQNSNKFSYQTYNGAKNFNYNFLYGMKRDNSLFILNDGTAITPISFHTHNPHEISLPFDTNGLNKGPNRLGYDVFIFTTAWNLLCAKENSQTGYGLDTDYNGRGCYNYAIKNINPDDRTKGYWESLYK